MQYSALKGIQDAKGSAIRRKKNEFPVVAELESCPLTRSVILKLEGCKWTLVAKAIMNILLQLTLTLLL